MVEPDPSPSVPKVFVKVPLTLPFTAIDAGMLPMVGGKAANLGELTRAQVPVPPGFCITTEAYKRVGDEADLRPAIAVLTATQVGEGAELGAPAAAVRALLLAAPVPGDIVAAVARAYDGLGGGQPIPVAVRSSATAEDLPFASFAGQQDTYLNVVGSDAVLDAVRRCWASLWTERAVTYRRTNGIDHEAVALAVVVQQMVDARVAGVMFTADPLTGRRRQIVIDAAPGLGEAVVSGAANPDHFVADSITGQVLERRLGDKKVVVRPLAKGGTEQVGVPAQEDACLSDQQVVDLARLGTKVEEHFGAPQDTEWAVDVSGRYWLTQARPITTLYPLPEPSPGREDELRVYFSINVAQGVYGPITPMGVAIFMLIGSSMAGTWGYGVGDRLAGPSALKEAAWRLFVDVTPVVRSRIGRALASRVLRLMEARSGETLRSLFDEPRLAVIHRSHRPLLRRVLRMLVRLRVPIRTAEAILFPAAARARAAAIETEIDTYTRSGEAAIERLDAIERGLTENAAPLLLRVALPLFLPAFALLGLAAKLLGRSATSDEVQTVLRALPHNPTTEMDMELWQIALRIRRERAATQLLLDTPTEELTHSYLSGTLPAVVQGGLSDFLHAYGHRSVAEIDVGTPRWAEDPRHIIGVLVNYLRLDDFSRAPDTQFVRGARDAERMVTELVARARARGRARGWLVCFCLRRVRELAGLRELPKYYLVKLLFRVRNLLWEVGGELEGSGRLASAEDVFFIDLSEAREALGGADMRASVRDRRASYELELRRRHVPRLLLSDGTEPEVSLQRVQGSTDSELKGVPASAGSVTAKARLIRDPVGARVEPGEILVVPSTDPGWTPLFLTAGGLVMEMGGANSHGAVVAREYGIPAVVGVPRATDQIETGQIITVDGSRGAVVIRARR